MRPPSRATERRRLTAARHRRWAVAVFMIGVIAVGGCTHMTRIKTHPDPDERAAAMRKSLERLKQQPAPTECAQGTGQACGR